MQWVTHTSVFKLSGDGKLEMSQDVLAYAKQCLAFLPEIPTGSNDMEQAVFDSVAAVSGLLCRLQQAAVSAVLVAMLQGEIRGKDCLKLIPTDLQPLANIMEVEWSQELEDIQNAESDLQAFVNASNKFESACSLNSKVCQEFVNGNEGFGKVTETCSHFQKAYIAALDKAISSLNEVLLPPLGRFLEKYGKVKTCAEKWDMVPVEWAFKEEAEAECKKDLEEFKEARREFLNIHNIIKTLVSCMAHTEDAALKKVLEDCEKLGSQGEAQCAAGESVSSCLLFCSLVIAGGGTAKDVQRVDSYVKKHFGKDVSMGHLPEKLEQQVQQLLKNGDGDSKATSKKIDKKEKKEKQEKKEKRPAEDAKASKEKKSKKSK